MPRTIKRQPAMFAIQQGQRSKIIMTPVHKAIWFIEAHLGAPLSLDAIAEAVGLSPFHLSRSFAATTQQSVMRYVRARRLTEAAKKLSGGAPDILSVALDAGYGSHEAFTRAFASHFGITPEALRQQRTFDHPQRQEPIVMPSDWKPKLAPPRIVPVAKAQMMAGLQVRYHCGSNPTGIPGQWQQFQPWIDNLPASEPGVAYGIVVNVDDDGNMDYMAAVPVGNARDIPKELTCLELAPQTYAVFEHSGHISSIGATCSAVWSHQLPERGMTPLKAPALERYDQRFDPHTGNGIVELWVPVTPP